jgi:hypothetical protein
MPNAPFILPPKTSIEIDSLSMKALILHISYLVVFQGIMLALPIHYLVTHTLEALCSVSCGGMPIEEFG